jgi:PEP-CTERM motif
MPMYIKFDGVDGEAWNTASPDRPPFSGFVTYTGLEVSDCTTGDPLTVCLGFTFLPEATAYELKDVLVSSFINPATGAMGSRAYLFETGSFSSFGSYTSLDNDATLTLSPVPEAATWLMLVIGFGILGAKLRRRRLAVPA